MKNKDSYTPKEIARMMDTYQRFVQDKTIADIAKGEGQSELIVRRLKKCVAKTVEEVWNEIPENVRRYCLCEANRMYLRGGYQV